MVPQMIFTYVKKIYKREIPRDLYKKRLLDMALLDKTSFNIWEIQLEIE